MIIAIDPGVTGCIAVLADDGSLIDHSPMPVMKLDKAKRVNSAALSGFLRQYAHASHCFIEKVGARPGQGVASTFSFGHSAGVVEGAIAGLGIPVSLPTPHAWKKKCGLVGKDKDAARARAIQLYPDERALDLKAKGQALADSIMIGLHGLSLLDNGGEACGDRWLKTGNPWRGEE